MFGERVLRLDTEVCLFSFLLKAEKKKNSEGSFMRGVILDHHAYFCLSYLIDMYEIIC